jgi:putative phage-type endonuclease
VTRVDHEQGGAAWLEWRAGGIGGSDAAAIMGVSPWQTKDQLLAQKVKNHKCKPRTGDTQKNSAMLRGTRLEPEVREVFNRRSGIYFVPVCGIHDDRRFMRSSFDGLCPEGKRGLEIKCPNRADHELALDKVVPEKYWPQCQHNLFVGGLDKLFYVSYSDNQYFGDSGMYAVVVVRPSPAYLDELVAAEKAFWDTVLEKRSKKK